MNFSFVDNINPTLLTFLAGMLVGVLLEVIAVFLTYQVFKRSLQSAPAQPKREAERPRPEPVRQPVRQESRMTQVGLSVPTPKIVQTSSVLINRNPTVEPPPVVTPRVKPVATPVVTPAPVEQVVAHDTEEPMTTPLKRRVVARQSYWYYVEGYDEPFLTIRDALNAVGAQMKNPGNIFYDRLGEEIRAKIRREVAGR